MPDSLCLWSAGSEENLADYVSRLKALKWQAMEVRCEETEECSHPDDLDRKRRFEARKVQELSPDGGMSELSRLCEASGMQHIFMTALKL